MSTKRSLFSTLSFIRGKAEHVMHVMLLDLFVITEETGKVVIYNQNITAKCANQN
jgi:hypothetical protein